MTFSRLAQWGTLLVFKDLRRWPKVSLALLMVCLLWVYSQVFMGLMPDAQGHFAHDWSLGFPGLLSQYYWYLENGPFAIPWFSPAKCGGFTLFANGAPFSVPTFLTYLISPVAAVRWTVLLFAGLGFAGMYLFSRKGLGLSRQASTVAATLYMFNGFFGYRSIMGHFFHADMLTPLVAALCVLPFRSGWLTVVPRLAAVGVCFAYMVHAAMLQILPPVLVSIVGLLLIHAWVRGWQWRGWVMMALGGMAGIALAAGKLVAMSGLLSHFPRTYYTLPGIEGFFKACWLIFQVVFLNVPADAPQSVVNSQWLLDRHEWEYGITPLPLLLLVAGGVLFWRGRMGKPVALCWGRMTALAGLCLVLLLPALVNWYSPGWNAFLKTLPYFDTTSNLLRWFIIYIPVVIVLSALQFDPLLAAMGVRGEFRKSLWCGLAMFSVVMFQDLADKQFYVAQSGYDVATVEQAWVRARAAHAPPPISQIVLSNTVVGNGPNDPLVAGASVMSCYEPILGYRLEKFPIGSLHPGPVFGEPGSQINIKNPACYQFPEENQCQPGDHFRPDQRGEAEAFTRYWPISFNLSERQIMANRVSWISLWVCLAALAFWIVVAIRDWWRVR